MMRKNNQYLSEGWWIDFMENEVDPDCKISLEMLLEHSLTDQLILENYRAVRRQIKAADPAAQYENLLNDPIYMGKLHGQIMASIKKPPKSKRGRLKSFITKRLPSWLYIMPQKSL